MNVISIKNKLISAFWFCIAFMFAGYLIPLIYLQYFDTRYYVRFYHPITKTLNRMYVNPDAYNKCEKAQIFFNRESDINARASVDIGLYKIDRFQKDIKHINYKISLDRSKRDMSFEFPLPCNLENGNYFIRGTVAYRISGVEKATPFETDNFLIR